MIPLTWPMPSKNLYDLFMFESHNSFRVHEILRKILKVKFAKILTRVE